MMAERAIRRAIRLAMDIDDRDTTDVGSRDVIETAQLVTGVGTKMCSRRRIW